MREATARRRVESFRQHYGDPHLHLACHAALPLALSPDLAYRFWVNFQRDASGGLLGIPWVAVADLLLSPLCHEVGDELYEMDEAVRSVLLELLATDTRFGPDRLRRIAAFLDNYVEQQLNSDDIDARDFAQAQHWAALAYTAPSAAASELARAFAAVPLADKPEVVRIASVVQALATPLRSFTTLLTYAQAAQNLARGRDHPAVRELQSLAGPENRVDVAGVSVPVPSQQWRWDVALSFAGAQRDYVGQVAQALKARGVRCFYDSDEQVKLWGTHLAEELPQIYARESAVVVVFISADYVGRDWLRIDRRAAFSRAMTEAGVYVLPARFDESELPGFLPDVVTVDLRRYTPEQFADLVVAKLADLYIISPSPAAGRADRGPAGGVRVREADPRRLGVHAAISVLGVPDEVLPEYVPRDIDAGEFGVRARVASAARRGGFVLLVGGSSVGKTRCAVEAVKALLPDWWLVHPAGPGEVAALAQAPPPRTVVWLDELQRYLDGEHGLTGAVVRALLGATAPVVVIGTLWPEFYTAYTTVPASGDADPHAREREVLDLADVIRINPAFSPAEQDRARAAAERDPRLRVALGVAGYGLPQTLAVMPQLVARWQDAKTADPYAWAVLTAALDTARLGARAPLSIDFLRAAAPGYCASRQQAEAPDNWFEQALAYATGKLYGGGAALSPAMTSMGQVAGYVVADYLIQHASRERRSARVPASTWDAILSHVHDPADTARLADSARNQLLYRYAIPLYRHAADSGDEDAALRLAELLAEHGDLDEAEQTLRARADADDKDATRQLAQLLADRGDLDGLRARADAGDEDARSRLADLLKFQDAIATGGGATSRSGTGRDSDDWARADLVTKNDLERSRRALEQITKQAQTRGSVNPEDIESIRSRVYWHLSLIASMLKPISDGVRVQPPRTGEQVDQVELAVRPIVADIVNLFGSEQNIVYFVDDEAYANTEQIRQLVELQENLSATIADYLDVVEGVDRGGARRSKARKDFMAAFRQLQSKIDLIVEGLRTWRSNVGYEQQPGDSEIA